MKEHIIGKTEIIKSIRKDLDEITLFLSAKYPYFSFLIKKVRIVAVRNLGAPMGTDRRGIIHVDVDAWKDIDLLTRTFTLLHQKISFFIKIDFIRESERTTFCGTLLPIA